jgi:hypothetical protein
MRLRTVCVQALVMVAAAAVAGGAMAAPAQAQPAPIRVPFAADSGDGCGVTRGNLDWHVSPGPIASPENVDVTGTVIDHPTPDGPPPVPCSEDGYFTTATFIAFGGRGSVRAATVQVDNESRDIRFTFAGDPVLEQIVVQVCRVSIVSPIPRTYCGETKAYFRPPVV